MRLLASPVYLDTNVLIYAVERGSRWTERLRPVFRDIEEGLIAAFTSELALAEALVRPYADGAEDIVALFEELLSGDGPIRVIAIDRSILRGAARLRGNSSLKLADAIHLATAVASEARCFLSNDTRLLRALPPGLVALSPEQLKT